MGTEKHITLSELLAAVRGTLAERFALGVWICAEVGSLNENRYSGHCYMELIEKGNDNMPRAKASAAVWRNKWASLSRMFAAATGSPLRAGMSVLLKVSVSFHEVYGFSLVVSDISPAYTLGEQERLRRQTIERLRADGVYDLNRQLPLPTVVQRVAVISSATAAGLGDFSRHIDASPYKIEYTLFEAIMQGAGAEESIVAALDRVADRQEEFDAIAVLRGGGSQSDLECFNAYPIACHIAEFPLPVITGIGHERDISVADMVAAVAQKTPTAVADFLVTIANEYLSECEELYARIGTAAEGLLGVHLARMERNGAMLQSGTSALLRRVENRLESALATLRHASSAATERQRMQLDRMGQQMGHSTSLLLQAEKARLERMEATTEGNNPQRILALGFALVRKGQSVVADSKSLHKGDRVELTLRDGTHSAEIL